MHPFRNMPSKLVIASVILLVAGIIALYFWIPDPPPSDSHIYIVNVQTGAVSKYSRPLLVDMLWYGLMIVIGLFPGGILLFVAMMIGFDRSSHQADLKLADELRQDREGSS